MYCTHYPKEERFRASVNRSHPVGDAEAVTTERMVRPSLGQEGFELFPDRLDDVSLKRGHGARSFYSGSLENSPDDGASMPALHLDAFPIDAASYDRIVSV